MGQSAATDPVNNINISLTNSTLISPKDILTRGTNTTHDGGALPVKNLNIFEK